MVQAIVGEIHQRQGALQQQELTSIYFGGGTPSLLSEADLKSIFEALAKYFNWTANTEITLEANPDDITKSKLKEFYRVGINRLSIGIQSFDDADLKFMNRAHNAAEADSCIDLALEAGFTQLTADLIYGSPTTSDMTWQANIEKMLGYNLAHISAYCLTVEEGTALHHQVKKGSSLPVDNDKAIRQFGTLMDMLYAADYEHYEISNFAKPEKYAVHNTNYWKGKPYLGIGPAAHSYDGVATRGWNIAHNAQYITAVNEGATYHSTEELSETDRYNEYILTALRTKWGIEEEILKSRYSSQWSQMKSDAEKLIEQGLLGQSGKKIILTRAGKYLADHVSMQLFYD